MIRIWLNHWFSTAYSIINLIRENEKDFWIVGSNENPYSVYKAVCDEWYTEPVLSDDEYVKFCYDFCVEHSIDVFLPRRGMLEISRNKSLFENHGIHVMVDEFDMISVLNNKTKTYEMLKAYKICIVPEYYVVTNLAEFNDAYKRIKESGERVCFKFQSDEGGKSFRLIDNTRKGFSALSKKQNTRMTLVDVVAALSEKETFSPIIVMPYLPDEEVSVDCLKTESGIVILPRIKDYTRIEKISYRTEILNMCADFYNKFKLEHPCNIQFKYLHGTPYFLEVNTRMSGGIHMSCLASGVNLPNLAVNKMIGRHKAWANSKEEKIISQVGIPLLL